MNSTTLRAHPKMYRINFRKITLDTNCEYCI